MTMMTCACHSCISTCACASRPTPTSNPGSLLKLQEKQKLHKSRNLHHTAGVSYHPVPSISRFCDFIVKMFAFPIRTRERDQFFHPLLSLSDLWLSCTHQENLTETFRQKIQAESCHLQQVSFPEEVFRQKQILALCHAPGGWACGRRDPSEGCGENIKYFIFCTFIFIHIH